MATTDEIVLAFIGSDGKSGDAIAERFPGFDIARLIRAHLVEATPEEHHETEADVFGHTSAGMRFVLTQRGAEAVGIAVRLPDA